jgi:glycosyltransferase involved in cell wall biosynthesis
MSFGRAWTATERSATAPARPASRRLRIALVGVGAIEIPPRGWGAVEDYIANLDRELRAMGHEVAVINRIPGFSSPRVRELVSAATLFGELRDREFDIVHAHSPITTEALSVLRRPYVLTSHSRYWLPQTRGVERLWRARDTLAVRGAAGVIALNPRVLELFRTLRGKRARPETLACVPFGVDHQRFRPLSDPSKRTGVVGLGIVAAHKRFDILAAAARRAGAPATIVGPLPDARTRQELTRLDPELAFTGEVPSEELAGRLAAGRVFVHPSDMELASVATIQAMACGLPVVGSDLVEGIVTEGHDGFIVDHLLPTEERVARTAERIERLMTDQTLWRTMGANARETVMRHHAWDQVARGVAELYQQVTPAS